MPGPPRCGTRCPSTSPCPWSPAAEAHRIVATSGCRTAKVKVADPGSTLAEDEARVEAVRDALGAAGRIRVDANGAWDVDTAIAAIGAGPGGRSASSTSSSRVPRSRTWPAYAAPSTCRSPPTSPSVGRRTRSGSATCEAADVAVLKVQPLGGVAACLRIAEELGLPVVVSSALETSVGLTAGVALAAALPELPYACGLATLALLTDDVVDDSLVPVDGALPVRSPTVSAGRPRPAGRVSRAGAALAGPAGRGPGLAGSALVSDPSTQLARGLVTALLDAGVTEVVVAPGSRSAPLAFAVYDAAAAGLLRLHTRLDERSAGFLALGLSKVGGRAAVVCTSGTAVANLHPAMLEAAHAGVRMVAVTADRPARLRGTGANQTTDQVGIFGPLVTAVDLGADGVAVARTALGLGEGPLHLNVQLDEPLVPTDNWVPAGYETVASATSSTSGHAWRDLPEVDVDQGPRTVVVAGDDAGPPARVLAEQGRWPLLAEPTSGSRTGEAALRCYRLLLDGPLGAEVERVVVLGHPTLSRPVSRMLTRPDVEVLSVATPGVWSERPFPVSKHLEGRPVATAPDDSDWFDRWHAADADVGRSLDALLAAEVDLTPWEVAGAVARALPAGGLLVVGASNPIRDLDLMVPRYEVGGRRKVIANRGSPGSTAPSRPPSALRSAATRRARSR